MGRAHVEIDALLEFWTVVAECMAAITDTGDKLESACRELGDSWKDEGYGVLDEAIERIVEKLFMINKALKDCNVYVQAKAKKAAEYLE